MLPRIAYQMFPVFLGVCPHRKAKCRPPMPEEKGGKFPLIVKDEKKLKFFPVWADKMIKHLGCFTEWLILG